jgi:amidohydrolase
MLQTLKALRHHLHQHPELSGQEVQTAARIQAFVAPHKPTEIITGLGGTGVAVVYKFSDEGPTVMIRCELDALPIEEANTFAHRSTISGAAHKCGHDGHMAIVAGLSLWLKEQPFKRGRVVLLFQPAEETGQGAHAVLKDARFQTIKPDYVFALHNLPGEPLHSIITVPHSFSATVESVAIYLTGVVSHASEPEKGINPALAMARIVQELAALNRPDVADKDFALLTPVHLTMGTPDYGISAGAGQLHYTLRTWTEDTLQTIKGQLLSITEKACAEYGLHFTTEWFDYFPASINYPPCNDIITGAAQAAGLAINERPYPFKFGEDFGWFSKEHKAALFGLGAGESSPALHHVDYDFPDELISTGIQMFTGIIERILALPAASTNNQ